MTGIKPGERPTGHQYTWVDRTHEFMNLALGLRHVDVIFPLDSQVKTIRCLTVLFGYGHLVWDRMIVETMGSDDFFLSSTYSPSHGQRTTFLRVGFVSSKALLGET